MDKLKNYGFIIEEVEYNIFKAYTSETTVTFDLNTGRYWFSGKEIDSEIIANISIELGLK